MSSNRLEKVIAQAVLWIRENQERFWAVTAAGLLAGVFIGLVIHHRQTESEEAWSQMGDIQGQMMQEKLSEARKGLDSWSARFQGTDAATYGRFLRADLSYRTSDYVQASQIYGDLAQTGRPELVKPLALSAQVYCEESAGHIPQAQGLAQTFLDRYPDHFMSGPMYITQARLAELAGNAAAAVAIYDRFILLFPQSPWTTLARARTQALGHASSGQNTPPAATLPH